MILFFFFLPSSLLLLSSLHVHDRAKGEEQRLATLITGLTGQLNTAAAQAQSADTLAKAIVDCNAKGMVYANSKCQPLALQDTTLACSSSTTGVVRYHST